MAGQLRKNDVGSIIRIRVHEDNVAFDSSSAIDKTLKLRRPSGTVLEVDPLFETDGSDGVFMYVTEEGDLNEAGPWTGQIFVEFPTGKWHTEPFNFPVGENLS